MNADRHVAPAPSDLRRASRGAFACGLFQNLETFSASPEASTGWEKLMRRYGGDVPDEEARSSLIYRENQAWIRRMRAKGYTIVDVGEPAGYGRSTFYEMELGVVRASR